MAAFGTHPRLARMLLRARELEAEGLTGIVADAAFLVALLEEDLRGSERLSVLFHRRQGPCARVRPAGSSGSALAPPVRRGNGWGCCALSPGPIASASCAVAAAISSVAG